MQLAVVRRRYPTNINHTPRSCELDQSENNSTVRYRSTSASEGEKKPSELRREGEYAMVTATVPAFSPPGPARPGPNVLRKAPSLTGPRSAPLISRRHSWTSSRCPPQPREHLLTPAIMEVSGTNPLAKTMSQDPIAGQLVGRRAFSTAKAATTYDMAYFLRNTGPPATSRETSKDDLRRPVRKKTRSIFKKRKEPLDSATPTESKSKSNAFVPPEGVEQKVTTRGHKYLQIVPHTDLLDHGRIYSPHAYCSLRSDQIETVSSDALDSWISTLSQLPDNEDLSVKLPTATDMRAHETSSSLGPSRPRTPLSFVSDARSMLPPAADGFGLSIIDDPSMESYCHGASDPSEALCSNPPSDLGTPGQMVHTHNTSIETAEIPLLEKRIDSLDYEPIVHISEKVSLEKLDEVEKFDGRSNEVLAGQGLRRPLRDEATLIEQEADMNAYRFPKPVPQGRRHREATVKARKIKALQQARRNIDTVVRSSSSSNSASPLAHEFANVFDKHLQLDTLPVHNGPPRHENRLTKTMLVAEHAPLPRAQPTRKPGLHELRERSISQSAGPDQSGDSATTSIDNSPNSTPSRPPKPRTPSHAPNIPTKSSARNTPTSTSFFTPNSSAKHHSTPLISSSTTLTPQAVTATTTQTGGIRTSVCTPHTSPSKEARLEARVEALERENRLLEAALMAVLKTSGTLNRCPCVVLNERPETQQPMNPEYLVAGLKALPPLPAMSPARASTPPSKPQGATELKRVTEEQDAEDVSSTVTATAATATPPSFCSASSTHTRQGSLDSNGSGMSALEVYLRTKIGV